MSNERIDSEVLNVPSEVTKEVVFGPKRTQALRINFDSATSASANMNYQFAPRCIVTNDWLLEYTICVQVVAPANAIPAGVGLFASSWGKLIAPREFALLWNCASVTIRLNDQVFSCQLSDLMPYMSKCISNKDASEYADVGPSLPDQGFFYYNDAQNTSQNVLASYNDARENFVPRGTWKYDVVGSAQNNGVPTGGDPLGVAGVATTGYVQLTMTTPFMIPPLHMLALNTPVVSLSNLYNININLNFKNSFDRILSVPSGWTSGAGNISNVFQSGNSNLHLIMLSSYPSDTKAIPLEVKLPNTIYDIKSQSVPALPAGASVQIDSQIYQYDSYPDAFIFYVHKRESSATSSDANSFLKLDKQFSININGDTNLLSGYTDAQMYRTIKKYVRMDFQEFLGKTRANIGGVLTSYPTSGPVYVLRPAIDLPISSESIAPNMAGSRIQLQFQNLFVVNGTSNPFTSNDLEFVVISVRSGEVTLTPSSGKQTSNTIVQADVVSALTKPAMYTGELKELEGGRMRLTTVRSGMGRSGGGRSGGSIPMGTAVPKSHTSRF
jgi:hypothetical protein